MQVQISVQIINIQTKFRVRRRQPEEGREWMRLNWNMYHSRCNFRWWWKAFTNKYILCTTALDIVLWPLSIDTLLYSQRMCNDGEIAKSATFAVHKWKLCAIFHFIDTSFLFHINRWPHICPILTHTHMLVSTCDATVSESQTPSKHYLITIIVRRCDHKSNVRRGLTSNKTK